MPTSFSDVEPYDIRTYRTKKFINSIERVLQRELFNTGQFKCFLPDVKIKKTDSEKPKIYKTNKLRKSSDQKMTKESSKGLDKKAENDLDMKTGPTKKDHKVKLDPLRGQTCITRHPDDGFYYPGLVVKSVDARHALVKFKEMGECVVPTRFVIATGGAVACPFLQVGDYVLVRVFNAETKRECYIPGIIRNTPLHENTQAKFYSVVFYSGQKSTVLRNSLIKISKSRFTFAVRFLKEPETATEEEGDLYLTEIHPSHKSKKPKTIRSSRGEGDGTANDSNISSAETEELPSQKENKLPSENDEQVIKIDARHLEMLKEQQNRLDELQHELESQQRRQERQQKRLRHETKKLAQAQKSFAVQQSRKQDEAESRIITEQQKLLEKQEQMLEKYEQNQKKLEEAEKTKQEDLLKLLNKEKSSRKFRKERTSDWVSDVSSVVQDDDDDVGETSRKTDEQEPKRKKPSKRKSPKDKHEANIDRRNSEGLDRPQLLEMRRNKPSLKEGEEVLARWSDEGWYYRGTIKTVCHDGSYIVEDACTDLEKIWREDIIADKDDADNVIQVKSTVIGLHPNFAFSYAPGVVVDVFHDLGLYIRFYDGAEARLPRQEVYSIPAQKFDSDVKFIVGCEEKWIGQAVVARKDETGIYSLGSVIDRLSYGREYVIEWADGTRSEQSASCIFGPFTKRHPLTVGDKVLAVADEGSLTYLPGKITAIKDEQLDVKFCNSVKVKDMDPLQVFWLSKVYYNNAVLYYKSKENIASSLEDDSIVRQSSIDQQQQQTSFKPPPVKTRQSVLLVQ